jgi:type II secretion system protein H
MQRSTQRSMRRGTRGFTLIELMTVVTIVGVIAAIAVVSMRRDRTQSDSDQWVNSLRNLVQQARRRAISTGNTYLLDVRANSARWCQVTDLTTCTSTSTTTSTCPNSAANAENGGTFAAPADAVTSLYATSSDVSLPNVTYAVPTRTALPSSLPIYFGANGTVDTNYCNVRTSGTVMTGVTLYVKASNSVSGTSSSEKEKRRRLVLYGISGRPRIIDNW